MEEPKAAPLPVPILKVTVDPVRVEVVAEPTVNMTRRGYAPVLVVVPLGSEERHYLYISARSISEEVEDRRKKNGGKFTGLRFMVKKASEERTAVYVIEDIS
jgi:hypothetical protein